ncbi:MAG: BREX system ATP-binding domain-containing protein [Chloroflexota bacterium]|nr:BREX system ATP-binding domain-containing protein [Chloroflexota bacterium]
MVDARSIGASVEHPQYGRGTIMAIYRNGSDWLVRFDSGLRFRRPRREFVGEQEVLLAPAAPMPLLDAQPMPPGQYQTRQLLEALRVGVAPAQHIKELTIGLESERASLAKGLVATHQAGGEVRAVIGEYGFGKTHLVELTAQEALEHNFLVAATSLDLGETPAHRSIAIYSNLMHGLRYPDSDERGLEHLVDKAIATPGWREQLWAATSQANDPLDVGLYAMQSTSSSRQRKAWREWLMGGRRTQIMNRAKPRGVKFPSIYRIGHNARQIAYLLSGVSVLARQAGYSGLCVLIDEAESYSLLRAYQRPKADKFFSAVIYAALQGRQTRISPDMLPQHRWRHYPPAYTSRQSLFFLFTITRSENRLPLEAWLDDGQVLNLEPHHSAQEIGQFMQQVMGYHGQAYSYEVGKRQRQVRRAAAEHLALGMRNGRLSIRRAVRLTVELFDLLYLYPEYEVAALLDELRQQMR